MDETGDQFETQSLNNNFKSMDLNHNTTETVREVVEYMKDKCESLVNNMAEQTTNTLLLRRTDDSEADDTEERTEYQSDDHKDKPKCDESETYKVTIVSTDPIEEKPTNGLTLHSRPNRLFKPRTEKWGESVGIVDEKGNVKRVISLKELHNYMILETWTYRTESTIYCSLINERYPRFFDSTIDYLQRWRMRYNIFVDRVLADKSDPSLVHMGELHLYFDLIPKYSQPFYINNSFYSNPNEAEKPLDGERYQKMKSVFDSLRRSQSIYQLKFPIRLYLFASTDQIFEKFRERYHEIMEESRAVHRKAEIRKQRQKSGSSDPPVRGGMSRNDRDFGQSSRDFHQTGRQFPRNERKFSEMGEGFAATEQQEVGRTQTQRSFGGNIRGFSRGRGRGRGRDVRSFSANNKKPFNAKSKNMNEGRRRRNDSENSIQMDVTFEDTNERYEKSTFGKPHKAMNRNDRVDDQRNNAFRDSRGTNGSKDRIIRPNNRNMDSGFRRQNKDELKVKDYHFSNYTPATGAMFSATDIETNRRSNSAQGFAQPTVYSGYN